MPAPSHVVNIHDTTTSLETALSTSSIIHGQHEAVLGVETEKKRKMQFILRLKQGGGRAKPWRKSPGSVDAPRRCVWTSLTWMWKDFGTPLFTDNVALPDPLVWQSWVTRKRDSNPNTS